MKEKILKLLKKGDINWVKKIKGLP
jgi:hypothetical protein